MRTRTGFSFSDPFSARRSSADLPPSTSSSFLVHGGSHRLLYHAANPPAYRLASGSYHKPQPISEAVRAAAEAILTIPSLSSSLFSFKFFYSSLPPILYPTKPPLKLKFDQPAATLVLLTEALSSLPRLEDWVDEVVRCSRALLVESALCLL
ncbi:hypothetical protein QQ045_009883 [Rhodiola kirilowii]